MTPELSALAVAILLHVALQGLFAVRANRELGPRYTTGPRDTLPERPLGSTTARIQRATDNSLDSLILFAPAALMVGLSHYGGPITAAAAWVFVAARLLYIPAYALGLAPWRSAVWMLGLAATVVLVVATLV
ncbi:membrane protein [Defluviimonas sp. 20V17]|uniref:Membrane protein n=1 Tax=Allgaiera indica TaxID=765699 RepID=A0AAN4ZYV0_9RHOB|nr:MAPEG family protein [Allgaiera indica]KDB02195.1 membrane protein [Defluviimonas sp. 20V17]GHD98827.1 membrane protein [Allgaiera indica]SDW05310.1 Uncharacterized conserved protein, MAPEG superfamily [Allgaiera indica]